MSSMNLLLVEDDEQDAKLCQNAIEDFMEEHQCNIKLELARTVNDAIKCLSNSYYDGAILDMRLDAQGNEGNQVIEQIKSNLRRIPVIIMTGTPDVADQHGFPLISLNKKGDITYNDIIKSLWEIYKTGITKIMGGKGEIEKNLSKIFIDNLLPQRSSWIKYADKDPERSEKALLRHALNHLSNILDGDMQKCYPEELYIYPPISTRISTGCIVKKRDLNEFYIVMNPACDLAERQNGNCNTDRALVAKIDFEEEYLNEELLKKMKNNPEKEELLPKEKTSAISLARNHKMFYYHWLPKTDFFCGGFINFRRISTYTEEDFQSIFQEPTLQISSPFLKDIISRFSSYYARQGQPDIDHTQVK